MRAVSSKLCDSRGSRVRISAEKEVHRIHRGAEDVLRRDCCRRWARQRSGVPFYDYKGQRGDSQMLPYYAEMGEAGVQAYWEKKNHKSIDGKPTRIVTAA